MRLPEIICITLLLLFAASSYSQQDIPVSAIIEGYKFTSAYDTSDFSTRLDVTKDGRTIASKVYEGRLSDIRGFDLDNDGNTEILIDYYSGGAHCCITLEAYRISQSGLELIDTIFFGNSGYQVEDLDNNGKKVIFGGNDMFAYAFTNYAETRFMPVIYSLESGKFVNVTSKHKAVVSEYIVQFYEQLVEMMSRGITCEEFGADTFNTEAGSMKTLLAAIVASYHSVGEAEKGYETIDAAYKCPDKQQFVDTLKIVYKLK